MPSDSQSAPVSKKLIWTGRIISVLPVLMMLLGGLYTVMKPDEAKKGFVTYGYPERSFYPIIVVEMACVVLYAIPRTSVLGAILLTGYLGGATATHVRVSEPFFMPVLVGVFVWLGLLLRDVRLRALLPLRN